MQSDGTGMICQAGQWIPLQARMGGMVQMASFLVGDEERIPKPNCASLGPTAQPRIFVMPRVWHAAGVNLTQAGGRIYARPATHPETQSSAYRFAAIDQGSDWEVDLASPRGADEALVITACSFT